MIKICDSWLKYSWNPFCIGCYLQINEKLAVGIVAIKIKFEIFQEQQKNCCWKKLSLGDVNVPLTTIVWRQSNCRQVFYNILTTKKLPSISQHKIVIKVYLTYPSDFTDCCNPCLMFGCYLSVWGLWYVNLKLNEFVETVI